MAERSILITGCSSGIGLCAATELKKRGWRVFATARRTQDVEKLAASGLESFQLDVNDSASIQRTVQQVLSATGGTLDALFNNAGVLFAGAVDDLSRDMMRTQFETNLFGPMELIRLVLPVMRKQGHGRIVQNSSILGVVAMPYYGAYNASKFALDGLTLTLRQECRGTGIHVSLLNPGPIQSELRHHALDIYQATIARLPVSAHKEAYRQLEKDYFEPGNRSSQLQRPPQIAMKQLVHALESNHPKVRYFIGWPATLLATAHKILPERTFYWLLSKLQG